MQPLKVRTSSTSPIEAEAIALLRSIERYQPPAGLKQRVRVRLLERSSTPPRGLLLWPAFVASLLLIAAGASASLGIRWIRHGQSPALSGASQSRAARVLAPLPEKSLVAPEKTVLPRDGQNAISPPAGSSASVLTAPIRVETPAHVAQLSEKVLVFDAMRALRRDEDPNRASRLLDEYLRRYPDGSLSEEALALAIEASTARGDSRTKNLADRYLARYPTGRFRPAAERARARFAP